MVINLSFDKLKNHCLPPRVEVDKIKNIYIEMPKEYKSF